MINNSEDVVKNVESNNVESTSNEQRQTNKPIVISRRRLLRAGVAGIPVVLTMAGIAPGQFGGVASAASGLNYDRKNTIGRFSSIHDDVLRNNLIYSDSDGFIFKNNNGGYYEETLGSDAPAQSEVSLTIDDAQDYPIIHEGMQGFSITISENAVYFDARLNKNGCYYTKMESFHLDKSKISITENDSQYFHVTDIEISNISFTLDSNVWSQVGGTDWYQVPETEEQNSITVVFNGNINCTDGTSTITVPITNCNFTVTSKTPNKTFEHQTNW